jgi:hypothetical protein
MAKESYRSRDGKIVGKDYTYKDRTVHEKKVGPGYKITGTTYHKPGGKNAYVKK